MCDAPSLDPSSAPPPARPLLPESPFQRRDPGAPPSPGQVPSLSAPPRARARKGEAATAASGPVPAPSNAPQEPGAGLGSGGGGAERSPFPPRPAPAPEESYRAARLLGGPGDGRPPLPAGARAPGGGATRLRAAELP